MSAFKPNLTNDPARLFYAAWSGDRRTIEAFIGKSYEPVMEAQDTHGYTVLYLAVANLHIEIAELLVRDVTDARYYISRLSMSGTGALDVAAASGDTDMIRLLVNSGADVRMRNKDGMELIHWAVYYCPHSETIKLLYEVGANIHAQNADGMTAMHLAAQGNKVETMKYLNRQMGLSIQCGFFDLRTEPIHVAARSGCVQPVEWLRGAGAIIRGDSDGNYPIHLAAMNGHVGVMHYLKEVGHDLLVRNRWNGYTSLHWATTNGHTEAVRFLIDAGGVTNLPLQVSKDLAGKTPMHLAASTGHEAVLQLLIGASMDLASQDDNGLTPLHDAASNGHLDAVIALCEGGADLSLGNGTPMTGAAEKGHLAIVKYLAEAGADVEAARRGGRTPLHLAAGEGHFAIVQYLVETGAKVNVVDDDTRTPLHLAAKGGHLAVVQCLEKAGAKVDARDDDGRTPLYLAAQSGHLETVQALRGSLRASDRLTDKYGETSLHRAAAYGHVLVAKELPNFYTTRIRSVLGYTAADAAKKNGHYDVAQELKSIGNYRDQ
jgi:ankyrin repeat protein